MNEIKVFDERELLGKEFKIYGTADEPLFLAKDVAEWIEHSNARVMLQSVDDDEKVVNIVYTLGGNQEAWMLTENGLYEVLMQSRKPIAKEFKKQVKEILKTIRKTGGYQVPKTYAQALRALADVEEEKERLALENEQMKPKAEFYDAVTDSKDAIPMGEVAKVLDLGIIGNFFLNFCLQI